MRLTSCHCNYLQCLNWVCRLALTYSLRRQDVKVMTSFWQHVMRFWAWQHKTRVWQVCVQRVRKIIHSTVSLLIMHKPVHWESALPKLTVLWVLIGPVRTSMTSLIAVGPRRYMFRVKLADVG